MGLIANLRGPQGAVGSLPIGGTQPGSVPRYDGTAWRTRGPYELWLEDFAPGGNITYASGDPVTSGDNCTPFLNAAVAKAAALNPNRGGVTIRFDRQRYWLATQPAVISLPLTVEGSGVPGVSQGQGKGCTQIIVADGCTGMQFVSASHSTIGPVLRDFHIYGNNGAATGNGILIKNFDGFEVSHVAASNFVGGTALDIDGGTGGAQYGVITDFRGGVSAKEIRLHGTAPNGIRIIAPRLEGAFGATGTPRAGSVGISIESGDTCRIVAPVICGYAIGIDHAATGESCEVFGMRSEYNNVGIQLEASSNGFALFGFNAADTLLAGTGSSIGINIVAGASNYTLIPTIIDLVKSGHVAIQGHVAGKGSVVYKDLLNFQAGAKGTGVYSVSNLTTDRALNVTGDTLPQVAEVLGTLIADLQARGLIG